MRPRFPHLKMSAVDRLAAGPPEGRVTPDDWIKVSLEPDTPFEQYGEPVAEPALPFDKYGFLLTDELPAGDRPARVDERDRRSPSPAPAPALAYCAAVPAHTCRMCSVCVW